MPSLNLLISNLKYQQLSKNVAWLFGGKSLLIIGSFLINSQLIRHIGPNTYGTIAIALAIAALFEPLATFDIKSIVVKNLILNQESKIKIISNAFFLCIVGSCTSAFIIGFIIPILLSDDSLRDVLRCVSFSFFFKFFLFTEYWFDAQVKGKIVAVTRIFAFLLSSLVKIGVIFYGSTSLVNISLAFASTNIFYGIGLITMYRKVDAPKINIDCLSFELCKDYVGKSLPLLLSATSTLIYLRSTLLVAPQFLSDSDIGIFSISQTIVASTYLLPESVVQTTYPLLIKQNSEQNQESYNTKLAKLLSLSSIVLIAIVYVAINPVIQILYGSSFFKAIPLVYIMMPNLLFISLLTLRKKLLIIGNNQNYILYYSLGTVIISIIINGCLINFFGLTGAAIATLIIPMLATFLLPSIYRRPQDYKIFFKSSPQTPFRK